MQNLQVKKISKLPKLKWNKAVKIIVIQFPTKVGW